MPIVDDAKIQSYVSSHPWLKLLLTLAMAALGTAKGRGWFSQRYGL
jgi:hypothetical protein